MALGLSAIVVLGLLLWGMKNPLAWVVFSVLAIGIGVGCMAYGMTTLIALGERRTTHAVEEAAVFIGGGTGGTVAGVVLLVVALLRRRKRPEGNA